ncbi:MAG: type II toxin-antitoxin system RelE/ParE family toxin [Candidatus Thiodiazotropha sp. (ex Ustalcina ferruginea)]|nr:type II toxin-antitoxin system RelE/ParE family toxin [Candidatus Thiodiazotropha sp. (ex Ustalcina ferruginea)]
MTASYSIRKLAEDDLERIWLYTYDEWGVEQADKYIRLLISRFTWITENPLLGKKRDDVKTGYYCFPEGIHLIFYVITKTGVDVIGIPHQSMDIATHLESMD